MDCCATLVCHTCRYRAKIIEQFRNQALTQIDRIIQYIVVFGGISDFLIPFTREGSEVRSARSALSGGPPHPVAPTI